MIHRFFRNRQGNIAVPGAIMFVAVIMLAGGGMDMMMVSNQKSSLQSLADNAALSAVREMAIVSDDAPRIEAIAKAYVERDGNDAITKVSSVVNIQERTVTVLIEASPKTSFPGPMGNMQAISVTATAELSGRGGNICMIGLSPISMSTLRMRSMAKISADTCAIYSNSTSMSSMSVASTATVSAELICVAGGYQGKTDDMAYKPIEDCPQIEDPLRSRLAPPVGACDFSNVVVTGDMTLDPGVYCGGLNVDGGTATLNEGVYIIKGGPLQVTNDGTLQGDYVGFFLADDAAKIGFDYKANIDISAPKDGIMTGLLIMSTPYEVQAKSDAIRADARAATLMTTALMTTDGLKFADHTIRSDNARRLVGTIYLPNGKLVIDGRNPIADRSEYTVIIADTFELRDGPNLVLRTNYDLSDIPVPEGVGPTKDVAPVLVQ